MATPPFDHTCGAIFDWDGVVVDSREQHERSWFMLAADLGRTLPGDFLARTFGMRNEQIIPGYAGLAEAGDLARIRELADRKESYYRELVAAEGLQPLPGVTDLLERLAANSIPTAVGSSTPRANIDVVIESLGLSGAFHAMVTSEDVTAGKPAPEVFELAAQRIDRAPDRCVVFEDAPVGIQASHAAGIPAVALTTTHPADSLGDADLIVANLAEVELASLAELLARR